MQLPIEIKILDPRAKVPAQGTPLSAGFDIVACIDEPISVRRGDHATLIPTGLAIFIGSSSATTMGLILPRSGLGHRRGLVLGNTAGVVDADYQNQWFVSAWNRGQNDEIIINPGDAIAQVVFVPVVHPEFKVVEAFSNVTQRSLGGLGSTGVSRVSDVTLLPGGGEVGCPGLVDAYSGFTNAGPVNVGSLGEPVEPVEPVEPEIPEFLRKRVA